MTEPPAPAARPSPAAALERRFQTIWQQHMQDMPMVNPALRVQAVDFQPWDQHWLGVLVTPWFMNLMLMPRIAAHWSPIGERETRHYVFPAGVFEFIGGRDAELGDYQACSLFSPMFEFAHADAAADVAQASLKALFDPGHRLPDTVAAGASTQDATPAGDAAGNAQPALSKRDFLFGRKPGAGKPPAQP